MRSLPLNRHKKALFGAVLIAAGCLAVLFIDSVGAESKKVRLRENKYYYSAFNRRDPFKSLIVGDFVRNTKMTIVDLNAVELVGIIRGELDRFALLEDEKGYSYILRVGDRVKNGSVVAIGEKSMVARVTNFGQTTKFTLHLTKREEGVMK
ncbi:MAG: hypothetical protein GTO51_03975 [Candidatus Latescibacteria bacterium]|nr:hypothetical protein [Candidatus Latescibacterota bacterium]NIM20998.1 hypothetical protein [Candidatus Latescibacterota bacterium]NIM65133.1 hypothetical protein [Candidatus Latescibacterota bacterium]NIO01648.1 hypothetical protein [Candidatus Latescibacterota bacterium]NIO28165.1 hypothetical protein [Candidatus Latescibacterota bacterium]